MKYFVHFSVTLLLILGFTFGVSAQFDTEWERKGDDIPAWFGSSTERGLGYGFVNGNHRLYVPSRGDGINVRILDADTGIDIDTLDVTGVSGGLFIVNDAGVSDDGIIFVSNMTLDASSSDNPFKVYKYTDESAIPENVISFNTTETQRLGDLFTVVGSYEDGTLEIYAASTTSINVYKWSMVDDNGTFVIDPTPDVITRTDGPTGASAVVGPLGLGDVDFYYSHNGAALIKYGSDGTEIGSITTDHVPTQSLTSRLLLTIEDDEYLAVYNWAGRNAIVVEVGDGAPANSSVYGTTPTIGAASAGGLGDIDIRDNGDGTFTIFVLATNNGIGAYTTNQLPLAPPPVVSLDEINVAYEDDFTSFDGEADPENWITSDVEGVAESAWIGMDDGTNSSGGKRSYGVDPADTNRALGFLPSSTRAIYADITFENNTGETIKSLEISYAGEHWRSTDGGRNNGWAVSYKIGEDDFVDIPALTFIAPNTKPTGALNGNLDENREVKNAIITGLEIEPEELLTLRFFGDNGTGGGARQGVAIDDFSLSPGDVDLVAEEIGFANLQWPPEATIRMGDSETVYAQVWIEGVTDTTGNELLIDAFIGVNDENTDPSEWTTWIPAEFNERKDNNYEYMADIGADLEVGTYYYASRFVTAVDTAFGGTDSTGTGGGNFWNGVEYISGVLTVLPPLFDVTLYVDMTDASPFDPETDDVYIAGNISDPEWQEPGTNTDLRLTPEEAYPLVYSITLEVEEGSYEYKFFRVIEDTPSWDNGEWPGDPNRSLEVTGDVHVYHLWGELEYDFMPIVMARDILPLGSLVTIEGVLTRAMGDFTRMQDETAGYVIRSTGDRNWNDDVESGELRDGDRVRVTGITSQFASLQQINEDDLIEYERLERDQPLPDPIELTLEDIAAEGRKYQSMLLFVNDLEIDTEDTQYQAATTYAISDPTLEAGTVSLRIGNPQDTFYDGVDIVSPFSFTGVLGQFHFTDPNAGFQLMAIAEGDIDDVVSVDDPDRGMPVVFQLEQNYPNPFNPNTTINFALPEQARVTLEVYNMLGQRVNTLVAGEELTAGYHNVVWDGRNQAGNPVASGVYIYRIQAGDFTDVKKMMFLK